MTEPSGSERSRDLDRLLTFVDAIVAIAITLLVLPLVDIAGGIAEDESVWRVVREHAGEFGGFALSFVVIARLWLAQHRVVRDAVDATPALNACLVAWSMTIVFLPFPTALLAAVGHEAATKILYLGTLTVSSALLGLLGVIVRRQRGDTRPVGLSPVAPSLVTALLFAVALAVSLMVPTLSYYPVLLLLLTDPVDALLRRRARLPARPQPGNA